ncbi:precorrin-6A synthase (deacetylating) [Corynebacterium sp. LK33]|uniref:precorrin-6A synthase (deacetylating) n=1 Tax=Corynebacterium sp. LK33 TaxID=2044574 RepID=UPI001CA3639F|nr:precorrin-6A synthase (deacetylating) [Corynebacterium sp. LK33]MBC6821340.1 precorrin-6A synthase (deacetylating) [Corynebacterium sp. LK33]
MRWLNSSVTREIRPITSRNDAARTQAESPVYSGYVDVDVIGIGAGSPSHITLEAIGALADVDVVFALDKGDAKADLLAARQAIVDKHAPHVELVTVPDPPRDRTPDNYGAVVRDWHQRRAELLADAFVAHLGREGKRRGAFLVWGDPSLYDSTLRILQRVRDLGLDVRSRVIPSVTAISALTAAHGECLNQIGKPVLITTGRRLGERAPGMDAVVMLDGGAAWLEHADPEEEILWGAFLGTELETLRRGRVGDIGEEIAELKKKLRAEHGWIMDIYLLRSGA